MKNSPVKTTDELLALLKGEMRACVEGKSHMMTADPEIREKVDARFADDPAYQLIGLQGFSEMWAYHDYREEVQKYQVEHQISGLQKKRIALGDRVIVFHEDCDQLDILPSDLEVLKAQKHQVFEPWLSYVRENSLHIWHGSELPTFHSVESVDRFSQDCDWAILHEWDDYMGLTLQLGWGDPTKSGYYQFEDCDSIYFHFCSMEQLQEWDWVDLLSHQSCPIKNPCRPPIGRSFNGVTL